MLPGRSSAVPLAKAKARALMGKKILFRFLAAVLCLITLPYGVIVLYERLIVGPMLFDSTLKSGIAAFISGAILLVSAFRGR
jgi:hypothetical protein